MSHFIGKTCIERNLKEDVAFGILTDVVNPAVASPDIRVSRCQAAVPIIFCMKIVQIKSALSRSV